MTNSPDEHVDVAAWQLGALDDDAVARAEDHIANCAECQREVAEMSGVADLLSSLPGPDRPSADFVDRLHRVARRRWWHFGRRAGGLRRLRHALAGRWLPALRLAWQPTPEAGIDDGWAAVERDLEELYLAMGPPPAPIRSEK